MQNEKLKYNKVLHFKYIEDDKTFTKTQFESGEIIFFENVLIIQNSDGQTKYCIREISENDEEDLYHFNCGNGETITLDPFSNRLIIDSKNIEYQITSGLTSMW
jgi:uncharacterized secreted protein with C-terminal beta-propeller domain